MQVRIRPATPDDGPATEEIKSAADALLVARFATADWPPPTMAAERASMPGFVLVAEASAYAASDMRVGFVHVQEIDAHAHLEQLSVVPAYGRRGIGRALVTAALDEARRRGHAQVTLRTYADVPWNAPRSTPHAASPRLLPSVTSIVAWSRRRAHCSSTPTDDACR